jgi:hypothetical protein
VLYVAISAKAIQASVCFSDSQYRTSSSIEGWHGVTVGRVCNTIQPAVRLAFSAVFHTCAFHACFFSFSPPATAVELSNYVHRKRLPAILKFARILSSFPFTCHDCGFDERMVGLTASYGRGARDLARYLRLRTSLDKPITFAASTAEKSHPCSGTPPRFHEQILGGGGAQANPVLVRPYQTSSKPHDSTYV